MLAEIAAANAAFKIIQTAVQNGKEIYDCGTATQSYFDNKSAIAKRVNEKGQGDLEAFMALEKIKEQEEILKETMIYAGRPNMYCIVCATAVLSQEPPGPKTRVARRLSGSAPSG